MAFFNAPASPGGIVMPFIPLSIMVCMAPMLVVIIGLFRSIPLTMTLGNPSYHLLGTTIALDFRYKSSNSRPFKKPVNSTFNGISIGFLKFSSKFPATLKVRYGKCLAASINS